MADDALRERLGLVSEPVTTTEGLTCPSRNLIVTTDDGRCTEHRPDEPPHIEGDELVYERESIGLGRHEVRLPLRGVTGWTYVEHHGGTER